MQLTMPERIKFMILAFPKVFYDPVIWLLGSSLAVLELQIRGAVDIIGMLPYWAQVLISIIKVIVGVLLAIAGILRFWKEVKQLQVGSFLRKFIKMKGIDKIDIDLNKEKEMD